MRLTKTSVCLHYFSKFMGILLFVLKYLYISLLLKMMNGFSWPAKIVASPFKKRYVGWFLRIILLSRVYESFHYHHHLFNVTLWHTLRWRACVSRVCLPFLHVHIQIPPDQLRRSHMMQYCWGYSNLVNHWSYSEGTLQLLHEQYSCHSSCSVPSKYPQWYSSLQ